MPKETINILALSGSLRRYSYNTSVLQALSQLCPSYIEIVIGEIGSLPLFNPDRENESIQPVNEIKSSLAEAAGLIIASPEYAHGISGPMKNALDWLVSGVEFPYKPIMLVNTSPRAFHGQEALREVLVTMSGNIVQEACVSVPLLSSDLDVEGIVGNTEFSAVLTDGLECFYQEIVTKRD